MLRQSRVMVVDDDADTLSLLCEVVEKEGYQVETAEDAETALQKLSEWQPDLVITDIHMPGKDGLALLAAVREKAPDILVILLTAYGSLKTAVDAIKAGAFDYLSKPFVVEDIRLVVRRALEHKKLVRENRSLRDQLRERYRFDNLVGSSAGMVGVYKLIHRDSGKFYVGSTRDFYERRKNHIVKLRAGQHPAQAGWVRGRLVAAAVSPVAPPRADWSSSSVRRHRGLHGTQRENW